MKPDYGKRRIRIYAIASTVGAIACIILFWRLASVPVGKTPAIWLMDATVVSGVLLMGGLFGMALEIFLRILNRERP